MQKLLSEAKEHFTVILMALLVLVLIGAGSILVMSSKLKETHLLLDENIENSNKLANEKQELEDNLLDVQSKNTDLENELEKELRNSGKLSTRVKTLTKLTTIDPELVKKYSKVYFLNENYGPTGLEDIPSKYVSIRNKTLQFHEDAFPYLKKLLNEAEDDEIPLLIVSAYRSFGEQSSLKSTYSFTYGAGSANRFSADQGYSEHQLGTAVDFTTPTLVSAVSAFESAPAYKWLNDNAYKFGFVLSYPKGNKYYIFEPWHWRFVGVDLASDLHDKDIHFYDMNQRNIDNYLIKIFD